MTVSRSLLLGAVLLTSAPLGAQVTGAPERESRAARAAGDGLQRPISLSVLPQRGDVFTLQVQQVIEMRGVRRDAIPFPGSPSVGSRTQPPPSVGPRRNLTPTRVTVMDFYAHSEVESSDSKGSVLVATTDSMFVRSGEVGQPLTPQRVELGATGAPSRVRVSPNGAMQMLESADGPSSSGQGLSAFSTMPAMLPDEPIKVGDVWERDIAMPSLPIASYRADGVLRATFRLDSTSRGGRDAYVSVRGTLQRDGAARELPPGSRVLTAGTLKGTLILDRQRGWIVDARTTIDVQSGIVSGDDLAPPMQLDIRISQQLRVR